MKTRSEFVIFETTQRLNIFSLCYENGKKIILYFKALEMECLTLKWSQQKPEMLYHLPSDFIWLMPDTTVSYKLWWALLLSINTVSARVQYVLPYTAFWFYFLQLSRGACCSFGMQCVKRVGVWGGCRSVPELSSHNKGLICVSRALNQLKPAFLRGW